MYLIQIIEPFQDRSCCIRKGGFMDVKISDIRREYTRGGLSEREAPVTPFLLFEKWLDEAIRAKVNEPTAMLVATVSPEGRPATRTVLLKELRDDKFIFYTNYKSRKGTHLADNPNISLSFVWHELERQVHIEGVAQKLLPEESDAYFKTRPYKSRIGARISPQSQVIAGRSVIMSRFVREAATYVGREIDRPEHWGGYAITANRIEFWQGRESRLHDRILYTREEDGTWKKDRLAP